MNQTKALLLTDVVDSTRMTEVLGDDAAAAVWTAHDRIARDLLPLWRGREIDKTDGMLLMFDGAADAASYALAYQHALAGLDPPLSARAGLHVGQVVLRENSRADVERGAKPLEVEGATKLTTARVMSVAMGGQVLLTSQARQALGRTTARLQSHGHWRVKGFTDPIELFELGNDGCAFAPPPDAPKAYRVVWRDELWLPLREVRHSLPAERDRFVGRALELLDLAQRLRGPARLVSVLGMGGTGKTRLVTRFAWSWLGEFPGGVWFCDLSQARNLDGICQSVARALDVPLGRSDPVTQLGQAIAGRGECLIVLDNFEQVARYAPATLSRWLDRAREARFVVTSREVLGLPGEEVVALAPLPVSEAASLFLHRAEAACAGFAPGEADRQTIEPLVELLEGLPLAIELAAARVRVMPPHVLLQRMGERFQLLALGGGRVDRQATLRAVFDWSWELLSEPEKAALAQLSVFAGGFNVAAAEAVLDLSSSPQAPFPLDALQSLMQKSFVQQVRDYRFDLLVSVQEYAAEHLATPGRFPGSGAAATTAAQRRHGAHFASLDDNQATADACADLENFIVACRRAVGRGDAAMASTLLYGAWVGLKQRGPFRRGVELAALVSSMPQLDTEQRARVHGAAGDALQASGRDAEALVEYERALELSRAAGQRSFEAQCLSNLGHLQLRGGHADAARRHFEAALVKAREQRHRMIESDVYNGLGNLEESLGRIEQARSHYEAALQGSRDIGDRQREGGILGNLALLHVDQGQMDTALQYHEAALTAARDTGSLNLAGNTLCNLGWLLQLLGRSPEAHRRLDEALALARSLGNAQLECVVLCNLGILLESLARPDEARDHLEAASALAQRVGDTHAQGQFLGYLGLLHARQDRHADARRCLDEGQALLEAASDRIGLGVLLSSRAEAAQRAGDAAAARQALEGAQAIAREVGAGPNSEIGLSLRRVGTLLGSGISSDLSC